VDLSWLSEQGLDRLPDFLTALAIGLLIGLERERNPGTRAGLRTFAIVALAGACATVLAEALEAPSLVVVGLASVAFVMVAAYWHRDAREEPDPGTTTIVAALACYLLAAMALSGWMQLSVMLAVLVTVLLYFKAELGGFARKLERTDLVSMLQFAVVAFIVLPLLPDVDVGPYKAINLRNVWWMVVLISGVSLAGYVALRLVGLRNAPLLGLLGGLVSSTATTLAYSRLSRGAASFLPVGATVILTANLVVLVRVAVLSAVVAPPVFRVLAPLLGLALVAGAAAYVLTPKRRDGKRELEMPRISNPVEIRAALAFAALYAVMLLASAWLADLFGSAGLYATAAISGLGDVDAIALSSMRLASQETVTPAQAATAVAIAVGANLAFKLGVCGVAGNRDLLVRCVPGFAAVGVGLAAGIVLFT
jgi:uncharacterized membrane protein (DUF4010 family)